MDKKTQKAFAEEKKPIFIVCPDRIRKQQSLRKLRAALGSQATDVSLITCSDLTKAAIEDLALSCMSLSLFGSGSKLFIFSFAQELKTELIDSFLSLLEKAGQSHWVIVTAEKKHRSDKIQRWFKREGQILELKLLEKQELLRFTLASLTQAGIDNAPRPCAEALVEMGAGDADRIVHMIEQLALYLGQEPLSQDALLSLFSAQASPNEFKLFEHIAARKLNQTASLVDELFTEGKSPYALAGLLQRSILEVCESKLYSNSDIGDRMALPGWRASKLSQTARHFSKRDLWKLLIALVRSDERLKGKSLGAVHEIRRLAEEASLR